MIEVIIAIILIIFFGLFVALSFPLKAEAKKLNQQAKHSADQSDWQDSQHQN